MKRIVLKDFNELVEIFPSLTLGQIIRLYMHVQEQINVVTYLLKHGSKKHSKESLEMRLVDYMKSDAFLSTYLARSYCLQNGYIWR